MPYKSRGLWSEARRLKHREIMLKRWEDPKWRSFVSKVNTGKVHSEETRKKIGLAQTGEKHFRWKGGITVGKEAKRKYNKEYNPRWNKENRLRYRLWNHKRRALIRNVGRLNFETIKMVYEDNIKKYGTLTCYLCLKTIDFLQDSLDHKTPLFRGGNNNYENLGVTHLHCNKIKHIKTEDEYRQKMDYRR